MRWNRWIRFQRRLAEQVSSTSKKLCYAAFALFLGLVCVVEINSAETALNSKRAGYRPFRVQSESAMQSWIQIFVLILKPSRGNSALRETSITFYLNLSLLSCSGRPRLSLARGPIYVKEGDNVTLPQCHVIGHPAPIVTWRRSFRDLPRERVRVTQGKMTILSTVKNDGGTYVCEASNLMGISRAEVHLVVVNLPRFTEKPSGPTLTHFGNNVTLPCSAKGDPPPVISWRKDGGQLPAGRTRVQGGSLTISNLQPSDTGAYTCVATSANFFHSEATVRLIVSSCTCYPAVRCNTGNASDLPCWQPPLFWFPLEVLI